MEEPAEGLEWLTLTGEGKKKLLLNHIKGSNLTKEQNKHSASLLTFSPCI